MITCDTIQGDTIKVHKKDLIFRPSVYAVIIKNNKILMLTMRSNGKLYFPGGGVELGEKMETALKREVKEETGLNIKIEKLLHFKENFFYYNPTKEAFHVFGFFYLCKPLTTKLIKDNEVNDDEATKPRWVDLSALKALKNKHQDINNILKLI